MINFNMARKNKVLVYDLGISSSKKRKYKNKNFSSYDGALVGLSNIGTKVYSEEEREGFYYINKKLKKDSNYEFSFTWVDGYFVTPILQIRESNNMDVFTTFQRTSDDCWQMYTNAHDETNAIVDFQGFKYFKRLKIFPDDEIKLVKKNSNIKLYCNRKKVIDCDFSFNSDFYIGFGAHKYGDRFTIFKQLTLKQI